MKISHLVGVQGTPNVQKIKQNTSVSSPFLNGKVDSITFSGKYEVKPVNVDVKTAEFVANSLSTSTSGHRAPYGSDKFNKDIVELLTVGVAKYAKDEVKGTDRRPQVLIGGDTRFATKESLPLIKDTLLGQNVDVLYIDKPVPTPLLALATREYDVDVAILMTASHNPWADGGYNLVTKQGAIAPADVTKKVAKHVVDTAKAGSFVENKDSKASLARFFPYDIYKQQINDLNLINWDRIQNSGINVYYDGLSGTGVNVLPELLDDYGIEATTIYSSGQEGPNPNAKNLVELSEKIKEATQTIGADKVVGLATDGDADRFGVVDENGKFLPANDVILLAAYHLAKNKGLDGAIIRSQATCSQVDAVGKMYNQKVIETPVGFKYIAEDIIDLRKDNKDVLVAGEESGGMTVYGHIPEKDGIIAGLLVLDLVAQEGKPISQILADVKEELNLNLVAENFNKKLNSEADKNIIMNRMEKIYEDMVYNGAQPFGEDYPIDVQKTITNATEMRKYRESGDGVKIIFQDGSNILVRKSGTEPLVKCYIEACGNSLEEATAKKAELKEHMNKIFTI